MLRVSAAASSEKGRLRKSALLSAREGIRQIRRRGPQRVALRGKADERARDRTREASWGLTGCAG